MRRHTIDLPTPTYYIRSSVRGRQVGQRVTSLGVRLRRTRAMIGRGANSSPMLKFGRLPPVCFGEKSTCLGMTLCGGRLYHVIRALGGCPRLGIVLSKRTSRAKGPSVGRGVSLRHTRTLTTCLRGGKVSNGHVTIGKRYVSVLASSPGGCDMLTEQIVIRVRG